MADAFRSLQLQQYHDIYLSKNGRADERTFMQFREAEVTIGPVETADGSCCVRFGNSSVICGSKLMIQPADPDQPGLGLLDVAVKLPPNSLYKYKWNKDAYADQEQVLANQIRKMLMSSKCLDWEQLVIEPGKDVWELGLEVICLDFDGNMLDVSLAAIIGCLMCTSVPEVLPKTEPGDRYKFTGEKKAIQLKTYPTSSSFAVMSPDVILADPTVEEEILSSGVVNIVTNYPNNEVVRLYKDSGFPVSQERMFGLMKESEKRASHVLDVLRRQAEMIADQSGMR